MLNHHLMANIWEKAKSILVGNLNSGLSYLITTVISFPPHFGSAVKAILTRGHFMHRLIHDTHNLSNFLIILRPWSCDTRIIRYSHKIFLSSCLKISKHVFNKLGIQCTTIPQIFTFVWIRKHARRHPGMYKS